MDAQICGAAVRQLLCQKLEKLGHIPNEFEVSKAVAEVWLERPFEAAVFHFKPSYKTVLRWLFNQRARLKKQAVQVVSSPWHEMKLDCMLLNCFVKAQEGDSTPCRPYLTLAWNSNAGLLVSSSVSFEPTLPTNPGHLKGKFELIALNAEGL